MTAPRPILEVELTFDTSVPIMGSLEVNPNGRNHILSISNSKSTLKFAPGLPHQVSIIASSMSFLNDLLKGNMWSRKFSQTYVYTSSERDPPGVYFSFGPLIADAYDGEKKTVNITSSMFLFDDAKSPLTRLIEGVTKQIEGVTKQIGNHGGAQNHNKEVADLTKEVADLTKEVADLIKEVADLTKVLEILEKAKESLAVSAQVNAEYELLTIARDRVSGKWDIVLALRMRFYRYFLGEWVRLLPTPEISAPGGIPEHGLLIGCGKADWGGKDGELRHSLLELERVIRSPERQVVLITGEPGSGKEVFSSAIHYGSVRRRTGKDGLVQRSVANMTSEDLGELLYGRMVDGVQLEGLIERAEGGTLFLDEFDKIRDASFYSELLRVLEANEYVAVEGREVQKVGKISWIFAGAFTGRAGSKRLTDLPPDFLSRLTARIQLPNLVKTGTEGADSRSYASGLFAYFYVVQAIKTAGSVDELLLPTTIAAGYAYRLVFGNGGDKKRCLRPVNQLAQTFSNAICDGRYLSLELASKESEFFAWTEWKKDFPNMDEAEAFETIGGADVSLRLVSKPKYAYDSARAIRVAAIAAFEHDMQRAMQDTKFWKQNHEQGNGAKGVTVEIASGIVKGARQGIEYVRRGRAATSPRKTSP